MRKKLTIRDLKNLIKEEARKTPRRSAKRRKLSLASLLFEDADPAKMDPERFPTNLSSVDAEKAKGYVTSGADEIDKGDADDVIGVTGGKPTVTTLKPSQTSMNIAKALAFALGMIKNDNPGGDLGAFISNDGHIMDGHHRWIASAMVNPSSKLGGSVVDFPATKLIAVLNALTKGKYGKTKGKPATGGFDQFKEAPIRAQLDDYLENGAGDVTDKETGEPNAYRLEPEDVQELIEKFVKDTGKTGEEAKDAAIDKFVKNIGTLSFELPSNAPSREDMPIIDKGDNTDAQQALSQGEIDVNPPYGGEGEEEGEAKEEKNESYRTHKTSDEFLMERWRSLAGLL
jgi:hypothetical protein